MMSHIWEERTVREGLWLKCIYLSFLYEHEVAKGLKITFVSWMLFLSDSFDHFFWKV